MGKDRKQSFLEAGEDLFSLRGYKDVSIDDITSHLGVATGSFYSYFRTKEGFYSEILDVIEARGKRMAERVVSRFQSPMNQLKALYRFTTLGILKNRILRGIQGSGGYTHWNSTGLRGQHTQHDRLSSRRGRRYHNNLHHSARRDRLRRSGRILVHG